MSEGTVQTCPGCDGWGRLRAGSLDPSPDVVGSYPCPRCGGKGHLGSESASPQAPPRQIILS